MRLINRAVVGSALYGKGLPRAAAAQESGRRNGMPAFSIWESRFPPEHVERGREVQPRSGRKCHSFPATSGQGSWLSQKAVVVSGTVGSGESCYCCCPVLNSFASPTNAEAWLAAHPHVHGTVISIPDAIVAGRSVFGDLKEE
jgi:Alkylmercury lyase